MKHYYDVIIVGGGASGFFTAINLAENEPNLKIAILERGATVLQKVRISGGGRCNVTHTYYEPSLFVKFYPRGEKELKGPFHQFGASDTVKWFEKHGVNLKTEPDGRIFPQSNTSETIINCFLSLCKKLGVDVITNKSVQNVLKKENLWKIISKETCFYANKLVLTTGNNTKIWQIINNLNHKIVPPVPSLFTFNCQDKRIGHLPGVAVPVVLKIKDTKLTSCGALLITHWGFSGPAILKLSAWGARLLYEKNYNFTLLVNWLNGANEENAKKMFASIKQIHAKKKLGNKAPFDFPNRLWESFVFAAQIDPETLWADLSKVKTQNLINQFINCSFEINGKSTFKDEFVTAGGIDLKEVNFKTMESKLHKNLYFAGEILNIDAITGGFNFQNAWTTGFLVARSIAEF